MSSSPVSGSPVSGFPGAAAPLVVFALADRLCALPADAVAQILPMMDLARPPGVPPLLAGIAMLGRTAVPVVRLARLFDLPEQPATAGTALLHLRGEPPRLLLVDRAVAVLDPPEERLPLAEGTTFAGVAVAGFALPQGACVLLDPARLLLREEERRIDAFLALERERLARAGAGVP
ncbi:chemotaxis protein CheW [Rhodospirillum centenum]|uniref:CheW3a n=1 Tax=Rhodospirillum centenum (strain ATCC 51521 / SW) TaxID=414684 RepID=B6ITY3_RHOCS|nr:chemotaxis protein CheW [Rhodospirillum centenum]ACI99519.1 cheW3a [Rhodospirillum centenum SW]